MPRVDRRRFLRFAGASLLTPYALARGDASAQPSLDPALQAEAVFGLSVASGDPTPSGVVLWTRVNPEVWSARRVLTFEVALDEQFQQVALRGRVLGRNFGPDRDYTVRIDLDGRLAANQVYFYRFIYNQVASRTGRCRTLPAPGAPVEQVRFGVLTCQDYTNGYYGAFAHLAQEEIDFVLHLGDFIYESAADPRFQFLPFPDRAIVLPSGQTVAFGLDDYRFIYLTYRADPLLQAALERHTWIYTWDDHETANDCYWDYARNTLGAPDHPFTTDPQFGNDPALLTQLKLDAQRAWAEYVPTRVRINPEATHPHEYTRIYRSFAFGDLADLFMTDERTYRSSHPCGEGDVGERYASTGCAAQDDPSRSMLGVEQRDWLLASVPASQALWKVWGNPVMQGALKIGPTENTDLYVNLDAWDGYEYERSLIMSEFKRVGLRNLIVLTGDLHSYLAAYLKIDYARPLNSNQSNVVGVEFMTPAVTSANFKEILQNLRPTDDPEEQAIRHIGPRALLERVVRVTNPHVVFFNSEDWGYAVVEFNRAYCEYTAYAIDKSQNSADAPKQLLRRLRVPIDQIKIVDA